MSDARVEAAAKALDAVEYEPGDNAAAARMADDPALYEFRIAQAVACLAAAARVSLDGTDDERDWTKELLDSDSYALRHDAVIYIIALRERADEAAAALAGLAAENERLKTALRDVALDRTLNAVAGWYDCLKRARAALQEPPDAP